MWRWIELSLVMLIIVLGLTAFKKIYSTGKERKKVWHIFRMAAEELGLEVKDGPVTDYGYPKLYGRFMGKKVYVHPAKMKRLHNTVYAVENAIPLEGDIVITSPETTSLEEDISVIDVPTLKEEGFDVRSYDKSNRELAEEIFTKEMVKKLKRLVWEQAESFRAFIIEPGICMFSTFKLPKNVKEIKENLKACVNLVEGLESNTSTKKVPNLRFEKISRKSRMALVEASSMLFFFFTGVFLLLISPWIFSWIFINLAAVLMILSVTRIVIIFQARGWRLSS